MTTERQTLLEARWVIPVEPADAVLDHHTVVLHGPSIGDVLPTSLARERYPEAPQVDLSRHALIPGLVNLHTHAAMTPMRGLADDMALMDWLKQHIWPAEGRHVSHQFVKDGTLLACAEMLRSGITCFNDMYFFPEASAQAILQAKMRAAVGIIAVDFPSAYAADADDYLRKGLETRDQHRSESLLSFCMAPHAPYTLSDKSFEKILTLADQLEIPIHLHLHETQDEIRDSLAQHKLRPLARMQRLGLVGPNLIAVHMVHLTPEEIALVVERGVHVAHCPTSNLKLGSGIAPLAALARAGANIGLGTDSAASNNRLDLLSEMRLAALLAKGSSRDATVLPAHQALKAATLGGAQALGLDHRVGSLEPGKAADIVAIDLSSVETLPCYDVTSHLIYAAGREHVSHVWVNGELLLDNRILKMMDSQELAAKAAHWQRVLSDGH
jgi:5-methylthioadenosine/S-adenosylhomocysteine deaminase